MRRAMGVMQHHDAVTGTEKQQVAQDYARLLSLGVKQGEKVIVDATSKLLPNFGELVRTQALSFYDKLNMSVCDALEARAPYLSENGIGGVFVMIYNPTGLQLNSSWVRLPIYVPNLQPESVKFKLFGLRGYILQPTPFQLVPIQSRIQDIPERKRTQSVSNMELVFNAAISGKCVEEVHLKYNNWATLTVRPYMNWELETDWIVGPIPDDGFEFSREVIVRYGVTGDGISPNVPDVCATKKNPTFTETEPIAGNYYPIVSRIMLKGSQPKYKDAPAMGFAVYTDRSQGDSSLENKQIELMLHRRLVRDDLKGVGEPLAENGVDDHVHGNQVLKVPILSAEGGLHQSGVALVTTYAKD
ncbi:unnamed protein product [Echinostoma caproni]|uniref:Alpha-mannosidase n=1 Tax=Echinostoma caproni TaxID=27848 RepID=A0A183B1C4_9TREM|nr:unnamed protein product [Echinostoma caproni]